MSRPVGRYRVIASDFADFREEGGTLEGVTVKVIYKQYVSVGYNVGTCEPNLFVSTYSFNTRLVQTDAEYDGSVSLFCDYLFCSPGGEETVMARHDLKTNVPIQRN